MAGDFPTTGEKLRKLINKSRAIPISFGFNPGTSEEADEYFAAHPRKTPELLGKLALTEGAGTKSAFGTFVIDASELHLTCFRTLPQLAKKVKRYLKSNKITLNVVVLDPDGNVLDSDVEVLEGWEASLAEGEDPEGGEDAAAGSDIYIPPAFRTKPDSVSVPPGFEVEPEVAPESAAGATADAADGNGEPRDPDMVALALRLRDLRARAAALPPALGRRLAGVLRAAAAPLREGDGEAAARAVGRIEAALARMPAPVDPRVAEAQARLADAVRDLDGETADRLRNLLERTARDIEAGRGEAALKGLRVGGRAVQQLRAAEARWHRAAPLVEPLARRAAAAGAAPVADAWQAASTAAGDGDWPAALAALPRVIAALRAVA